MLTKDDQGITINLYEADFNLKKELKEKKKVKKKDSSLEDKAASNGIHIQVTKLG